jgi:hypothetical protein
MLGDKKYPTNVYSIMFSEKEQEREQDEIEKKRDEVRKEILADINRRAIDEAMQSMINDIIREQEGGDW